MISKKTISTIKFILCISLVIFFTAGCGDMTEGKSAADSSIAEFHTNYNESNFDTIYSNSHKKFKNSTKYEEYEEFMVAVLNKLGKVTSTKNQNWKVHTYNFVTSAVMQQETQFEKGVGTETFTFEIKDGKALLVGYNINSRELIVN